jgi:outer membrane protein OmpA-like peptidoglycan-associated protein
LYAQWTAAPITIIFASNGGSGSLSQLSGASGATVTLPGASSIVRRGYALTSWNSAANGSGTSYSLGQSLTLTSTLTLYAQWKSVPTSTLFGAIGTFSGRTTALTPTLEKQVRSLAATVKTRKYTKVLLFGFTAATGVTSLDHSLSSARADHVANYLRSELRSMKVDNVDITTSGQGSVGESKNASNSRVEVFVT